MPQRIATIPFGLILFSMPGHAAIVPDFEGDTSGETNSGWNSAQNGACSEVVAAASQGACVGGKATQRRRP